ncbi:GlxA family transcriptional regulator [Chitinophaga ginsengisoli]|uniref:AraC family transcriptional regulator with amidase-like domain n=1 Tax=Chitinophaga ginsengisoli TaxID=363837 RepID=A0A2P8G2H5_9BACT|nr:helix-turn-helix domain-containing protein [Chitinophaga ginsengisoli]PSL28157.1 AraC family transcriptional regulator with amidase-like domain [Chitinophaga ginsengisoli]
MDVSKNKGDIAGQKKQVVIVAMTRQMLLDFTGPADVFTNADRLLHGTGVNEGYDVKVVAPTYDRKVITSAGIDFNCRYCAMDVKTPIDTLIIAGDDHWELMAAELVPFYEWLSGINEHNTRRIGSVCAGAFALAKVGLLNGRKATTHWEMSEKLKAQYPSIEVHSNAFFIQDGPMYTSAGVSSGIDLSLALVEEDYGKEIAVRVARQMVFYLRRSGVQAQFGNLLPVYDTTNIGQKLKLWLDGRLHEPVDLSKIAEHFNMSVRNLTRVLQKHTGMPPAKFIEKLRVEKARAYLEDTDMSLERIAEYCGLGNLVTMRRIFLRQLAITPSDYRRAFRTSLKDTGDQDLYPV